MDIRCMLIQFGKSVFMRRPTPHAHWGAQGIFMNILGVKNIFFQKGFQKWMGIFLKFKKYFAESRKLQIWLREGLN